MRMQILSLVDHPELLRPLAALHHLEWGHVSPFKTVEQHADKLAARIGSRPVPATYVLLIEHVVAGSVSLLEHDDIGHVHPDLSPWLASLLVVNRFRRCGYGRALVDHCMGEARAVGVQALYLYTHTHSEYYARIGWRTIEE